MNRNEIMVAVRRGIPSLVAVAIVFIPVMADADDSPAVDTSHWTCKFCPFEKGYSGNLELGAGYVSDDSFKFGEYTGLNQSGGFVVGDAAARYRNLDGAWFDLSFTDLGLDSRFLGIEGGKQGSYKLFLNYKELPHFITDTAVSPFTGIGSDSLKLPSGWVPAGTTSAMPALLGSLHGVDLETERKRLDLGASFTPVTHWEFAVRYRHETKTGALDTAGAFEFNTSQLVMPVDYVTDQFDASAAYSRGRFHAQFAYYGSRFTNNDEGLTWSNPYLPLVAGATAGELALPPSNQFHQLVMSAGYQFNARTLATADVAVGRMTQDEPFLPVTLNSSLPTAALPRSSLDGRVNTVTANLRLTSAVTDNLRLNGAATYDDRDNRTPQSVYDWITTDTFAALPRTNLLYSTTHSLFKLNADYAVRKVVKVSGGYDYDTYHRSLQDIDRTREGSFWAKLGTRLGQRLEVTLKGAHAERSVSAFQPNPDINPAENPLMRKYNMADRNRDSWEARADVMVNERLSLGLAGDLAFDNYSKSMIGLLDDRDTTLTADASLALGEKTSATLYLNHEQIWSHQANAELSIVAATWFARNNDRIDTGGIGIKHRASDKLDIGANYTVSHSTGEVAVSGATAPFPDLISRLDSVKLYASYRLKKKISLHLAYWYESYNSHDWMADGVTAATIPNVIALGQGSPSYKVSVVTLSAGYSY